MSSQQQNVLNLIKSFRQQWSLVCACERTTVCSADDMLLTLQLVVAEINKKDGKELTAPLSDVLLIWKHLVKDKLGLISDGMPPPKNFDVIKKSYDQFIKKSNALDLIDLYQKLSTLGCCRDTNLSSAQLLDFLSGSHSEDADAERLVISTPCKNNMDFIKIKTVVKKIFCSYLHLLVNSKNDIVLAHVLNCPDRGLGREAFTDLKHAARNKQMSLYLVATSFIRAVELGGKGYAPSASDPLRKHLKGLTQFVSFIDKLNEFLGGTHSSRTTELISAIKMHLIKGRGSGDSFSEAVVEVAQELDLRVKNIINLPKEENIEGTKYLSPARPRSHAINRGTALCGRETIKTLLILLDEEAASPPSKNKADLLCSDEENTIFGAISLLSLFRTPEQYQGSPTKPLGQRLQKKEPKLKQNLIKSQFFCTYKDGSTAPIKPYAFPSMSQAPTCFHPAPKIVPVLCFDEESIGYVHSDKPALQIRSGNTDTKVDDKGKSSKDSIRKSTKRKQDINENKECIDIEPPQKRATADSSMAKSKENSTTIKNKGKSATKKKLIDGQAKLTSFFRV